MTKQEEIREGTRRWLVAQDACHNEDCGDTNCDSDCPYLNKMVDKFFSYLHSQGVVLKGERKLPEPYNHSIPHKSTQTCPACVASDYKKWLERADCCAVEPLV